MMARPSKPNAAEPGWVALPAEFYAKTCAELVTFSHKTINSNAPAGGIRLSPEQALKHPYVSARTVLGAGINPALDYVANAGKTATAVKQLRLSQAGDTTVPADEGERLLAMLANATSQGMQIGTAKVSLRLRQLLLPRARGYVAVTPESAGGVSHLIRNAVRTHNERQKETQDVSLQRIPTAAFKLGGAKPPNVGALAWDMQRPLVFFAPTENRALKDVLALHFQGIKLRLPLVRLRAFRDWCTVCRRNNDGRIPSNMTTRNEEVTYIRGIAQTMLAVGDAARQRLLAHRDVLPAGGVPLVSANADTVTRGLIDPELRDKDWPRAFALRVATLIAEYRFDDGSEEFQFEQADIFKLQAMIEEVAR